VTPMDKLFRTLLNIGVLAFAITAGAFALRFAPGARGFSQNPTDWADFGAYLGGTLGAVFGLLAFIGVLITVYQQRTALDLQRAQSNRDELQSLISAVSKVADGVLGKAPAALPEIGPQKPEHKIEAVTVAHMLQGAGTAALRPKGNFLVDAHNAEIIRRTMPCIGLDAGVLNIELDQLASCLLEYRKAGGSQFVESFYRRRFSAYAAWMSALEVRLSDRVTSYFEVDKWKATLTPATPDGAGQAPTDTSTAR
jgi:hypothetical protein